MTTNWLQALFVQVGYVAVDDGGKNTQLGTHHRGRPVPIPRPSDMGGVVYSR
jgi:hypothetical protein